MLGKDNLKEVSLSDGGYFATLWKGTFTDGTRTLIKVYDTSKDTSRTVKVSITLFDSFFAPNQ